MHSGKLSFAVLRRALPIFLTYYFFRANGGVRVNLTLLNPQETEHLCGTDHTEPCCAALRCACAGRSLTPSSRRL